MANVISIDFDFTKTESYAIFEVENIPVISIPTIQGGISKLPSFMEGLPSTIISEFCINAKASTRQEALVKIKKDYIPLIQGIKRCVPLGKEILLIQRTKAFNEYPLDDGIFINIILGLGGYYISNNREPEAFHFLNRHISGAEFVVAP